MQKKDSGKKRRGKKKDEPYQKYDRAFQAIFDEFREDIGIESKKDYQSDEKWQYKRPDTVIILEDNFDYSKLTDKTFPCLKEWNTLEFKSCEEKLVVEDIPKYIANGNLLARQMLLHRKEAGLKSIKDYVTVIMISSNSVSEDIISDFEQSEFGKGFYIFAGINYFPVYLIVIHDLDIIKSNYPLLLLGNADKQEELWKQLIEDIKKELNAKNSEKLWSYLSFSIENQIFQIKEDETMKKLKELSEENESINKFFDDEFLGKILRNKDDDSINRLFDDEFLKKVLVKKGKDFLVSILTELGEEEVTGILEKIRKSKK
ncbi:MAG: hypothetical protein ABRQ39_00300 [Candidatus Eremiobacterota bacterium]